MKKNKTFRPTLRDGNQLMRNDVECFLPDYIFSKLGKLLDSAIENCALLYFVLEIASKLCIFKSNSTMPTSHYFYHEYYYVIY